MLPAMSLTVRLKCNEILTDESQKGINGFKMFTKTTNKNATIQNCFVMLHDLFRVL